MKNLTTATTAATPTSPRSAMNSQEVYRLFKNSKLAQVARPLRRAIRDQSDAPTHQIVYTPKLSAARSNFGMKSYLPKQVGLLHIVFNDTDNRKNMPDVEKYSGAMYNRLKFQELGVVPKNYYAESNALFPGAAKAGGDAAAASGGSLLAALNLTERASASDIRHVLRRNPTLHRDFHRWLLATHPALLALTATPQQLVGSLHEYLRTADVARFRGLLSALARPLGRKLRHAPASDVQGTAGFLYAVKGRFANTPNGIKYGAVAPGRMVGAREAAVAGFVARLNDRTTLLQNNYAKNYPGKHMRQFVMPFKITEAEVTPQGSVKVYADGVKVGLWLQRAGHDDAAVDRSHYQPLSPHFGTAAQRNGRDNVALQNLMNLISH